MDNLIITTEILENDYLPYMHIGCSWLFIFEFVLRSQIFSLLGISSCYLFVLAPSFFVLYYGIVSDP